jgi:hypothetical protein
VSRASNTAIDFLVQRSRAIVGGIFVASLITCLRRELSRDLSFGMEIRGRGMLRRLQTGFVAAQSLH